MISLYRLTGRLPWVRRRRRAARMARLLDQLPPGASTVKLLTRPPLRVVRENERKLAWQGEGGKSWKDWSPE